MLSYVQLKILSHALKGNALRYSDLKPDDIEQDLFNYHLRFLLDKKYLKKENDLYFLTDFGKKYVIQMDIKGEYKSLFRVSVIAVVFNENLGKKEILMQKRLRHPYYGDINIGISGKVEPSELVTDAAKRKVKEETGLIGEFENIGTLRQIRKDSNGHLVEDTFYNVCVCNNSKGELLKATDYGLNFWFEYNKDKILDLIKDNVTFSNADVEFFDLLDNSSSGFFHKEYTQTLSRV